MAARVNKASRKGEMPESWKDKNRIGQLASRLEAHAQGKLELSSTQIKAAEILLSKTVPNLSSIEQHNIDERDKLTEDQILSTLTGLVSASPHVTEALLRIILQADPGAISRIQVAQTQPVASTPVEPASQSLQ